MKIQISLSAKRLDRDEYIQALVDKGCEILGEGNYGVVLSHPTNPNLVVKIATTEESESYCYEWLKWCKRNPSPYVPRLERLEKVTGKNYFIAEMERLKPATHEQVGKFIEDSGLGQVLQISKKVPVRWDIHSAAIPDLKDKTLRKLMTLLYTLSTAYRLRHGLDVTAENVMLRGSQFVFTDPIV